MPIVGDSLWKYMRIVPQVDFICQQLASFDLSGAFKVVGEGPGRGYPILWVKRNNSQREETPEGQETHSTPPP